MAIITVIVLGLAFTIPAALLEGFQWLGRKAQGRRETRYLRKTLRGDYQYDYLP